MILALVVQELLVHFKSLLLEVLLEVLVKLILLVAFTCSGQTYNKNTTEINTVHNTKISSIICMNA
jgi:hypothetical protein